MLRELKEADNHRDDVTLPNDGSNAWSIKI